MVRDVIRGRGRVYRDRNRSWWRIFAISIRACNQKAHECRSIRLIRITPSRMNHMHRFTISRNCKLCGGAVTRGGTRCRYLNIELKRRTRTRVHGYAHGLDGYSILNATQYGTAITCDLIKH